MAPYRHITHRDVYRNPWVSVEAHQIVHPNGLSGEHVLIVTPPASAAIVEDGDELLFTRQARFGSGRDVIEIVKGGAGADETPLDCARRELAEELGYEAASWESLGVLYEIPSIVKHPVSVFLARDLHAVVARPEAVERIELVRMPRAQAIQAAVEGDLDDAVTVAALLRYALSRA